MKKISESIRRQDFFAERVHLTYKGRRSFKTVVGGCVSIIMILALISIFTLDIYQLAVAHPEFSNSSHKTFVSYTNNNETFKLDTKQQTVALAVSRSLMRQSTIDEYFRVAFTYETLNYEGSSTQIWIQAVKCTDFYAEEIADEKEEYPPDGTQGFFTSQFVSNEIEWICPNITEITLFN